jgi:D-amino-acid oxidase
LRLLCGWEGVVEILVLGCGVSGLTTALTLLDAGHTPRIWARDLPPNTTSNVAAAVWYPYRAYPEEKVTAWGAAAYERFVALAETSEAGVVMRETFDLRGEAAPDPWWIAAVPDVRRATPEELPTGYGDGFVLSAPVIDTSIYMNYLLAQFRARGGQIEQRAVASLDEAFAACPVVVNCTGLGAREVAGDIEIHAARGQVIRIKANGFERVLLDNYGPNHVAYIVPRISDIVLGGTDVKGDERLTVDDSLNPGILERCANMVERRDAAFAADLRALRDKLLAGVTPDEVVSVACGLRPVRPTVRLEREELGAGRVVIHNYGHGGAGVTLSWGCAAEVATLLGY